VYVNIIIIIIIIITIIYITSVYTHIYSIYTVYYILYACIGDVFLSGCVRCTMAEFSTQPVVVYFTSWYWPLQRRRDRINNFIWSGDVHIITRMLQHIIKYIYMYLLVCCMCVNLTSNMYVGNFNKKERTFIINLLTIS
jgi:hypothetical protein